MLFNHPRLSTIVVYVVIVAASSAAGLAQPARRNSAQRRIVEHTPAVASPPELSAAKAFAYYVAIYSTPVDAIDFYAQYFDSNNYRVATADEFERARYRAGVQAKLTNMVASIDFSDKFVSQCSKVTFAEYSFSTHSFPVGFRDCTLAFNYYASGNGFDVRFSPVEHAINANDFNWSFPMTEIDGSALVKFRPDRRISARIVFSIVRFKNDIHSSQVYFSTYLHSVDFFRDDSPAHKLGVLSKINSGLRGGLEAVPPPLNRADQRLADERAAELRGRMLAEAGRTLVGEWRGRYAGQYNGGDGTVALRADGSYKFSHDDNYTVCSGTWSVLGEVLTLKEEKATKRGMNDPYISPAIRSRLLEVEPKFVMMEPTNASSSETRYKWSRVE